MLIRLSKNAYVRQYGPFSYVIERIRNFDQVYLDAEVFFRWLTREPMEIAEVLGVPNGTAKYWMHQAVLGLRKLLGVKP